MTLVIDSSVAASWSIPDEDSPAALRALTIASSDGASVPSLFWHELRNVLLVSERRGRLTSDEVHTGLAAVADLSPNVDELDGHSAILALARRHTLSAYDAAYLELAIRRGGTIATLDNKLAKAALAENLTVISDQA
ncbi:Predicted nucleic acid-binding protein, contains PIN domain [Mesorhizobium albiziae]|uniref:Ribonuclease VapC n=1 Tax=Neomesorhizobium albiziae TaxID=335020 RepID=A0A1I4B0S0_9HYPH|nr:type II toxin-antitoxin system VapC family toxin [Mesorhizobium albiziae]GLS34220.1 ribonuclease VapC [Mesorhizobium albiziae]SFK62133.1 Predicted nucleic acid-binding protein, contains PIN domain [Mesorhizobium albiziae]